MRETFRAWQEQFETFALEVILGDRRDKKATAMRGVLFCLSKVFLIIVKGRRWLYEARIIRDHPLGVQVITVGNLTVEEDDTGNASSIESVAVAPVVHVCGNGVRSSAEACDENPNCSAAAARRAPQRAVRQRHWCRIERLSLAFVLSQLSWR